MPDNTSRQKTPPSSRRIGLVGCVKQKLPQPQSAKNLYRSTLFTGRRSFVEQSCDEWWILSAEHGLVDPEDLLAPYDFTLNDATKEERRQWATRVFATIVQKIQPERGDIFEIHAGANYRDFGLTDALENLGCIIENPTKGMGIGKQLQFYQNSSGTKS